MRVRLCRVRPDVDVRLIFARAGNGRLLGGAKLVLPLLDNVENLELELVVAPDLRRRGVGRALLGAVTACAADAGRKRLAGGVAGALEGDVPGEEFARAVGARQVLKEVHRMIDLHSVRADLLATQESKASAAAQGYELVQWADGAPSDVVADLAALMARMSTDAPLEDLTWEPENWDAKRVRIIEEATRAAGDIMLVSAARRPGESLVAFTSIGVSTWAPETGYQWDTLVVREHRGRRLGLLVKLANLRLLAEKSPATRWLHTWNAAANEHMVAINDAMGFRPIERAGMWQLEL
jgi:GNAT superfamily N-acetyltransferase